MNTFFSQELRFADLGDQRLNRRLERLVTALADKPDEPSATVWEATELEVLLRHFRPPSDGPPPTSREAVRLVARPGGFLNRRGDGEPGVKCLWRGWQELQAMVKGYRLSLQLSSP